MYQQTMLFLSEKGVGYDVVNALSFWGYPGGSEDYFCRQFNGFKFGIQFHGRKLK